jgi:Asp-tRNA(Asn)/Glu-tRNA(Gln) amidotransferase A subunit family amidase
LSLGNYLIMSVSQRSLLLVGLAFLAGAFSSPYIMDAITAEDVRGAARLAGLAYSPQEIDSTMSGLADNQSSYLANRATALPNSLPPAFQFQPLLPDFQPAIPDIAFQFQPDVTATLPANRKALAYYGIAQLAGLIKTRQISSEELTRFFIARLKEHNPTVNCVVTMTEELAIGQARQADQELASGQYRGILHGIPYGIKDMFATRKYPTTYGATPYKDQVLDYDATVVRKLREAGAILVAKLSLGELAMGDTWFGGKTRNPWDTSSGSSGSSAGPAAAVSAGLLPFAIGSETLGSIVSPSTVCGTTGLRPSFGRVSRYGAMALSWTMDKIGPICRSAEDCAMVFQYIHGPDGKDLSLASFPFYYPKAIKPASIKIGYTKSEFERSYPFKQQDSTTLKLLEQLGFQLVPIEFPASPKIDFIVSVEGAAAFDELTTSNRDELLAQQMKRSWPNIFRTARFVPAVEYIKANRIRTQLQYDVHQLFDKVDLIVHPSWASSGLRISNYTGHPALVMPNGFNNGKPTSITFMGQLYQEGLLLRVAEACQQAADFHQQHPAAFQ